MCWAVNAVYRSNLEGPGTIIGFILCDMWWLSSSTIMLKSVSISPLIETAKIYPVKNISYNHNREEVRNLNGLHGCPYPHLLVNVLLKKCNGSRSTAVYVVCACKFYRKSELRAQHACDVSHTTECIWLLFKSARHLWYYSVFDITFKCVQRWWFQRRFWLSVWWCRVQYINLWKWNRCSSFPPWITASDRCRIVSDTVISDTPKSLRHEGPPWLG